MWSTGISTPRLKRVNSRFHKVPNAVQIKLFIGQDSATVIIELFLLQPMVTCRLTIPYATGLYRTVNRNVSYFAPNGTVTLTAVQLGTGG